MFSTVTSAFASIALTSSRPRGDLRLIASDFLLALNMWKYHGSSSGLPGRSRRPGSPVFGFSILTTSAPSQARASVQDVPASNWVKSTTRMPARQLRSWQFSLIADPSYELALSINPVRQRMPPGQPPQCTITHARSFTLQLAESYLTASLFRQILQRIERLAWHPA